ncbi:MAG: flavodoxin [Paludibacteraceae bacterium]
MQKVGIFYGSSEGNTEGVAKKIQKELGVDNVQIFDVAKADASELDGFQNLMFGVSTLSIGELQDDFEDFFPKLKSADLTGKTIALFGCGDQYSYPDSFMDAIGIVYLALKDKGCKLIGKTSTEGYDYDESVAEIDGEFVGLAIDEDNESNLTDERVKNWVEQIKNELT